MNVISFVLIWGIVSLFIILILLTKGAWDFIKTEWWKPRSGRGCDISWDDVASIIEGDPLETRFKSFACPSFDEILRILGFVLIFLGAILIIVLLFEISFTKYIYKGNFVINSLLGFLFGSLLTYWIHALRIRAQVQSNNRIDWINSFREQISIIVANAPEPSCTHDLNIKMNDPHYIRTVNSARSKLELLINPSERDHRALSFFLRQLAGFHPISIDCDVENQLRNAAMRYRCVIHKKRWNKHICKYHPLYLEKTRFDITDKSERDWLISIIIRLSNAVLKREWERVKRGR